ncbi:MAG: hypothetical protein KME30_12655 [Iphinoe sp. HA4291-MV1]|jgi:hypothetical protein|nr:hypothetical protein [Iphinoe sp. HA4291-MV1]
MSYELEAKVYIRLEGEFPQSGMNYKVKYEVILPLSFLGHPHENLAILMLRPLSHDRSTGKSLSK